MSTPAANPLLRIPLRIPFDAITPAHVEPAVETLLAEARAAIAQIVADPSPRSFASTLLALDAATAAAPELRSVLADVLEVV